LKHEDLQLKVYQIYTNNDADDELGTDNWVEVDEALLALHSVVSLHRPKVTDGLVWCVGCDATQLYPCPTINIIHSSLVK
jgi:hypothetical protein